MINKVTLIKLWLTINQNCENLINGDISNTFIEPTLYKTNY